MTAWVVVSFLAYCCRRGTLRGLGAREVARRHFTRGPDWPAGANGHVGFALACAVCFGLYMPAYPLIEPCLRTAGLSSFYFYYPKANGAGMLIERVNPTSNERGEQILRLDWHRFNVNVGKPGRAYVGPTGGWSRHPPTLQFNLPHIDLPTRGVRHWPWRQHAARFLPGAVAKAARAL